jgi:Peptidase family M23
MGDRVSSFERASAALGCFKRSLTLHRKCERSLVLWVLSIAYLFAAVWRRPLRVTLIVAGSAALVFLFVVARWDLVSYWLRYILFLILLLILYQRGGWWFAACLTGALCTVIVLLRPHDAGSAIDMAFPLRGALFCVVHGGSQLLLNAHRISKSQAFALDIVSLTWWGGHARGLYPAKLEDYRIFGMTVYSPCSGAVTAIVNELPDEPPGHMDRRNPAGNHIVIRQNGTDIYVGLAHLLSGSILVQVGDAIQLGQQLARVGNSGNTSEPHLHIHAKRGGKPTSMLDGKGVPILFAGRWLIRNSLVSTYRDL